MPLIINLAISGGVIWALLIIFNEGRSFKFVQQEAFLILGLVIVTGVVVGVALPESLDLLVVVAQAVALFLGVEKICDLSRTAAVRVTVWYLVITGGIGLGFALLPG